MFNLNFSFRRLRVLAAGAVLFSLCSLRINAASLDYEQPFKLSPLNDGIQLGLGVALSGSALVCDKILNMKESEFNPADLHQEDIPLMEQMFMNPYSKPLHIVGTATLGVALVSPAIFAILPSSEWLTVGTMYAETVLIANGIKEWGKLLVNRARPYMYYDGYPQDKVEDTGSQQAADIALKHKAGHCSVSRGEGTPLQAKGNNIIPKEIHNYRCRNQKAHQGNDTAGKSA